MTRFELTRDLDALNVCDLEDFAVDGWVHGALSCPCARAAGLREALLAVDCGALEALLEEAGEAFLSAPLFEGRTACWFAAAAAGDETLVRFLAERDADVNAPAAGPSLLFTPLHAAVLRGHLDIVQALSDHGASLDPLDARGRTPLWLAARCGDADMCVLLCGLGADADEGDQDGRTPIVAAIEGGHTDTIYALHEGGCDINKSDHECERPVFSAARFGNVHALRALLSLGADGDTPTIDGDSVLAVAVANGSLACVRALVEEFDGPGTDIDSQNAAGETACWIASEAGQLAVLTFLAESGADLDIPNDEKQTPLWIAAARARVSTVQTLIRFGADVDEPDEHGASPCWIASCANAGFVLAACDVIRCLHEGNADLNLANEDALTPWEIAGQSGHSTVQKVLKALGASVDDGAHELPDKEIASLQRADFAANNVRRPPPGPKKRKATEGGVRRIMPKRGM